MQDVRLSVVVPTLGERVALGALMDDLRAIEHPIEIIVADGGSTDGTLSTAIDRGAEVVICAPGRAVQLNAGAAVARGEWLLFLHADSRLDAAARSALVRFLDTPPGADAVAAHFSFGFIETSGALRWIERGQHARQALTGLVYGDQGLLVRRSTFNRIGGYPSQPLMEDVEILRRLRRMGTVSALPAVLRTSARRYRRQGGLRTALRNGVLVAAYHLGVAPARLARWYPAEHGTARRHERLLLVFAKYPTPGSVKTRLARAVGVDAAAGIYRTLAEGVVAGVRTGDWTVVVCYAPSERGVDMDRWLGHEGLAFWPQAEGDLGIRLRLAFDRALSLAGRVVVIGTDAPGVDGTLVARAFAALDESDVVMGPAHDGGYYLLGTDRPRPALFEGIPWSEPTVAEVTRNRAADLRVHELPTLTDVDHVEDLPDHLRG